MVQNATMGSDAPEARSTDIKEATPARRVLIVDDENGARDLMSRWLESGGYSVTTAASAEEALGRLNEQPAAVALCDIRMPGHDGVWLAERIRQQFPETAVIMATGVHDADAAVQSLRRGVIDYLTKPFGKQRLREAVTRGLEFHHSAWDARLWRESLEQEMAVRRARLINAVSGSSIDGDEAVDAMLSMLTLTDREAYAHAYRVAALSVSMGARSASRKQNWPRSSTRACCTTSGSSRFRRRYCASRRRSPRRSRHWCVAIRRSRPSSSDTCHTSSTPSDSSAMPTSAWTDGVFRGGFTLPRRHWARASSALPMRTTP